MSRNNKKALVDLFIFNDKNDTMGIEAVWKHLNERELLTKTKQTKK